MNLSVSITNTIASCHNLVRNPARHNRAPVTINFCPSHNWLSELAQLSPRIDSHAGEGAIEIVKVVTSADALATLLCGRTSKHGEEIQFLNEPSKTCKILILYFVFLYCEITL